MAAILQFKERKLNLEEPLDFSLLAAFFIEFADKRTAAHSKRRRVHRVVVTARQARGERRPVSVLVTAKCEETC